MEWKFQNMLGHVNFVGLDPPKRFYMLVRSLLPLNGELMTPVTSFTFVGAVPSNLWVPTIGSCSLRGHATQVY